MTEQFSSVVNKTVIKELIFTKKSGRGYISKGKVGDASKNICVLAEYHWTSEDVENPVLISKEDCER